MQATFLITRRLLSLRYLDDPLHIRHYPILKRKEVEEFTGEESICLAIRRMLRFHEKHPGIDLAFWMFLRELARFVNCWSREQGEAYEVDDICRIIRKRGKPIQKKPCFDMMLRMVEHFGDDY